MFVVTADTKELEKAVASYGRRSADLSSTMAQVAEHLVSAVNDRWNSAGDGEWEPLAESTLKARRGTTAQILIDTGRAVASVKADHGPDYAEASTDVGYMRFHASEEPRTVIPYRNPFDLKDEALEEAAAMIAEAIAQARAA